MIDQEKNHIVIYICLGFSDPFCIVKMGEKRLLKTRVQKKTLFPKWNESTTFEICDENQMIEIVSHDSSLV